MDVKVNVKSKIEKYELIDWQKAKWVQNKDLKAISNDDKERLKESFKKNDFIMPFFVWEDKDKAIWILDGHHRQKILNVLLEEKVKIPAMLPAVFISCENKEEAAKLVLIYSSQYAKTTQEGLNTFLEMYNIDFSEVMNTINVPEFSEAKFEQKYIDYQTASEGDDTDIIDIEQEDIIVNKGDIFMLGKHRIICGSSFDEETLNSLTKGQKARILCTDPPYNLKYSDFGGKGKIQHEDFAMGAGEMSDDEFVEFLKKVMTVACSNTVNGSIHYIFMDDRHSWHMGEAAKRVYDSPIPKHICVWKKDLPANGSFYRRQYELCFTYKNGKEKHFSNLELQDRFRSDIWEYAGANSFAFADRERVGNKYDIGALADHPTPKPTDLLSDICLDTTKKDDIVLELFSGSGSMLIACEKTKRRCYAVEIEPKYVQSTIIRYLKFCNKNQIDVSFEHLNGKLTIDDFSNAKR